jgi:integrase
MPRQINRLTAREIASLTKPGYHGDGGGLALQITRAGVKSWVFRFMIRGKAYMMGLGPVRLVSLARARQKAHELSMQLLEGVNPLEAKRSNEAELVLEKARAMTFDECAQACIESKMPSWKNPKHAAQWRSTLATYCTPVLGAISVADVDTGLVLKALRPIWEHKHETATRLRGRIEDVLAWATVAGYRVGENPARWKGHLEYQLAKISKVKRVKHHPSLAWTEIPAFMQSLRQQSGVAAKALELAILCASRSGEVRGARWAEFDLDARIWTIPAARMKAHREHQVALSTSAVALLKSMTRTCDLVFPGTKGQALSDMTLTALIRRMDEATPDTWRDATGALITAHGFRSTFRMWVAEKTNFPREVAEHALAHQLPDMVERAYQRGTMFEKRLQLMELWGQVCRDGASCEG